jgi:ParB-like chromosome segregation protein Spo0J
MSAKNGSTTAVTETHVKTGPGGSDRRFEWREFDQLDLKHLTRTDMGDLQALAKSIKEKGVVNPPIVNLQNQACNGGRRVRAAKLAGLTGCLCQIVDASPLDYEHIDDLAKRSSLSERAMHAEKKRKEEAKLRQGRRNDLLQQAEGTEPAAKGVAVRDEVAREFGFPSSTTMDRAIKVVRSGVKELIQLMDAGEITLTRAEEIAKLTKDQQIREIDNLKKGRSKEPTQPRAKKAAGGKLLDPAGTEVPEGLKDVFLDRSLEAFKRAAGEALEASRLGVQFGQLAGKAWIIPYLPVERTAKHIQAAVDNLSAVLEAAQNALPYCVCPTCKGEGKADGSKCKSCRGAGWLTLWRLEDLRKQKVLK